MRALCEDMCLVLMDVCLVLMMHAQAQNAMGALLHMGNGGFARDDAQALLWCVAVRSRQRI